MVQMHWNRKAFNLSSCKACLSTITAINGFILLSYTALSSSKHPQIQPKMEWHCQNAFTSSLSDKTTWSWMLKQFFAPCSIMVTCMIQLMNNALITMDTHTHGIRFEMWTTISAASIISWLSRMSCSTWKVALMLYHDIVAFNPQRPTIVICDGHNPLYSSIYFATLN
jgi:hypothetical protein